METLKNFLYFRTEFPGSKNEKKTHSVCFGKWNFLALKNLIKLIYHFLYSACVNYGTLCYATEHQVLPTQFLPREAEDFPRGRRYFNHVPLLT